MFAQPSPKVRRLLIVNVNSGLVLDVSGGSKNGGANVIQWTNHNGLNQQWSLVPTLA